MMELPRRRFLAGLLAAPVIIRTPGLLMPVKPLPVGDTIIDFISVVGDGQIMRLHFAAPVRRGDFQMVKTFADREGHEHEFNVICENGFIRLEQRLMDARVLNALEKEKG